jgi:hypothetical protein
MNRFRKHSLRLLVSLKNPAYAKLFSSFLPESAQKWNKVFHQFNWPEHARLFGVIQTIASKKSFFQKFDNFPVEFGHPLFYDYKTE